MDVLMEYGDGVAVRFTATELHFFCKAAAKVRYQMLHVQQALELIELELAGGNDAMQGRLEGVAALAATAVGMTGDQEGDDLERFADELRRINDDAVTRRTAREVEDAE